jgi:hypothetical protein
MSKINLEAVLDIADAEIVPAPTMSLATVKPRFEDYVKQADKMVEDVKIIDVKDEESLKIAVSLGGEAKKITKLITAQKDDVLAEAKGFVSAVGGFCKIITDKLANIEADLKKKITTYQTMIELKRREQEEIARKASEDLQKQINKEAKKAGVEAPQVPVPVIPKQETVTRTESGTSSYQAKTWKCYIERPDEVPREYCEPVGRLLNNAVKQGIRTIPGCRIVEESDTRFRT